MRAITAMDTVTPEIAVTDITTIPIMTEIATGIETATETETETVIAALATETEAETGTEAGTGTEIEITADAMRLPLTPLFQPVLHRVSPLPART